MTIESAQTTRLKQQMAFLIAAEQLKTVLRKTSLIGGARRENSAEHSWQVVLLAMVLAEHANEPIDIWKVVQMLIIHDLGEISAGDTFHFAKQSLAADAAEREGIEQILGMLPEGQRQQLLGLWAEFDSGETAEARYARAIDRIWPIIQNAHNEGGTWLQFGITHEQAVARSAYVADGATRIWKYIEEQMTECAAKGHFAAQDGREERSSNPFGKKIDKTSGRGGA